MKLPLTFDGSLPPNHWDGDDDEEEDSHHDEGGDYDQKEVPLEVDGDKEGRRGG